MTFHAGAALAAALAAPKMLINGIPREDYASTCLLILTGGTVISAVMYFVRTVGADTTRNHYLRWIVACIPAFLIIGIPEYRHGSPMLALLEAIGFGTAGGIALAAFFGRRK